MSLHELSSQELALCCRVEALASTGKDRQVQLDASNIGEQYLQVHRAYLHLAANSPDAATRLEALKRLVFLSWYGNTMVESDIFSGLSYHDETLVWKSYALLDAYLAGSQLDHEMQWMLSFYSSWEDFIPAFTDPRLPTLLAFVAGIDHTVLHVPKGQLPPGTMHGRGQMGTYWQSLGVEAETSPAPGQ